MKDWNKGELSKILEDTVVPYLQYIRISGTLVGGLIGIVIHLVMQILF